MLHGLSEAQELELGQEHGLERREGNGVALPHAAHQLQPKFEQLRARRLPQPRRSKVTVLRRRRCESRMCPRKPRWAQRVAGKGPELVYGVRVIVGAAQACLV